ncbi:MAG: hypothetical protein ACFCVB_06265 [Nodosilinea sp.]
MGAHPRVFHLKNTPGRGTNSTPGAGRDLIVNEHLYSFRLGIYNFSPGRTPLLDLLDEYLSKFSIITLTGKNEAGQPKDYGNSTQLNYGPATLSLYLFDGFPARHWPIFERPIPAQKSPGQLGISTAGHGPQPNHAAQHDQKIDAQKVDGPQRPIHLYKLADIPILKRRLSAPP